MKNSITANEEIQNFIKDLREKTALISNIHICPVSSSASFSGGYTRINIEFYRKGQRSKDFRSWVSVDKDGKWQAKLEAKLELAKIELDKEFELRAAREKAINDKKAKIVTLVTKYGTRLVELGVWSSIEARGPSRHHKSKIEVQELSSGGHILVFLGKKFPIDKLEELAQAEATVNDILEKI
jgi:hypothetical protein